MSENLRHSGIDIDIDIDSPAALYGTNKLILHWKPRTKTGEETGIQVPNSFTFH